MELDKFITETLNAIVKGIKNSQEVATENNAIINPYVRKWDLDKTMTVERKNNDDFISVSTIDFDIAVSTSNEQQTGINGGINVMSVNIGGKASDKDLNETVSRIKFNINVVLPNNED